MTTRALAMGLRPGFYMNNYICAESSPRGGVGGEIYMRNMRGSVEFLVEHGFQYIKIDSGSVYNDLQLWSDLLEATGSPIAIENCHQGGQEPNATWCPFDLFRTAGDLHSVGLDVELLATAAALNQSRVGCWAYPDTLDASALPAMRSQFGAYAVMSAPLMLSFDILDDGKLLEVWDIITNEEVIQVNQRWAGAAGRLLRKWSPHAGHERLFAWAQPCGPAEENASGWAYDADRQQVTWRGRCLSWADGAAILDCQQAERPSPGPRP
ncbi:Slc12a5 [Symbiodinium natans]|uniref:Slc12a5 protein n=1 Tax=Symbiodinium natans TaxID=878477 RepID=A0A812V6Z1_9DINO|nr:Slc12a5 [Symbiodinium natans]